MDKTTDVALSNVVGLQFFIAGKAIGKPRATRFGVNKRFLAFAAWAKEVRRIAQVPDGFTPTIVDFVAIRAMPASWSAKKARALGGQICESRPDVDNIHKAIMDALFKEDASVASGLTLKRWARDGEKEGIKVVAYATQVKPLSKEMIALRLSRLADVL